MECALRVCFVEQCSKRDVLCTGNDTFAESVCIANINDSNPSFASIFSFNSAGVMVPWLAFPSATLSLNDLVIQRPSLTPTSIHSQVHLRVARTARLNCTIERIFSDNVLLERAMTKQEPGCCISQKECDAEDLAHAFFLWLESHQVVVWLKCKQSFRSDMVVQFQDVHREYRPWISKVVVVLHDGFPSSINQFSHPFNHGREGAPSRDILRSRPIEFVPESVVFPSGNVCPWLMVSG